jgi:hypothetical protein
MGGWEFRQVVGSSMASMVQGGGGLHMTTLSASIHHVPTERLMSVLRGSLPRYMVVGANMCPGVVGSLITDSVGFVTT